MYQGKSNIIELFDLKIILLHPAWSFQESGVAVTDRSATERGER